MQYLTEDKIQQIKDLLATSRMVDFAAWLKAMPPDTNLGETDDGVEMTVQRYVREQIGDSKLCLSLCFDLSPMLLYDRDLYSIFLQYEDSDEEFYIDYDYSFEWLFELAVDTYVGDNDPDDCFDEECCEDEDEECIWWIEQLSVDDLLHSVSEKIEEEERRQQRNRDRSEPLLEYQSQTLKGELDRFIGSETLYQYGMFNIFHTEGVRYLAEKAGCYWLLDVIGSWQVKAKIQSESLQLWQLAVNADKKGILTCHQGSGDAAIVTQRIEFTDFPLPEIKLYLCDGVLVLPSEYSPDRGIDRDRLEPPCVETPAIATTTLERFEEWFDLDFGDEPEEQAEATEDEEESFDLDDLNSFPA